MCPSLLATVAIVGLMLTEQFIFLSQSDSAATERCDRSHPVCQGIFRKMYPSLVLDTLPD